MTLETKFSIGDKVYDTVTGYAGTITAITVQLGNKISYLIEDIDETSRPIEAYYDEGRLEVWDDYDEEDDCDCGCDGDCESCQERELARLKELEEVLQTIKRNHEGEFNETNLNKTDYREVKEPSMNSFKEHKDRMVFEYGIKHMTPEEMMKILRIIFS